MALLVAVALSVSMALAGPGGGPMPDGNIGKLVAVVLYGASIGLALSIGYGCAVASGGFAVPAYSRVAVALASSVLIGAVVGVAGLCAVLDDQPAGGAPLTLRPLLGWASFVLPQLAALAGLIALHPSLCRGLPRRVALVPLTLTVLLTGGACIGLALETTIVACAQAERRHLQIAQAAARRDALVLLEIEGLDPHVDLARLLEWTAVDEAASIRTAALAKVRAHPQLTERLATMLRDEWRGEALAFLADNEPPDAAALARPLADAIVLVAADVRHELRQAHSLRADHFERRIARVLAAVARFAASDVDYVPAIRALRAAFDEPRVPALDAPCRQALDRWLAAQAT